MHCVKHAIDYHPNQECPCCVMAARIADMEVAIGKGINRSAYSFGWADGEREGRNNQLQIQLSIIRERNCYQEALQAISDQTIGDLEPHLYAYAVLNPE